MSSKSKAILNKLRRLRGESEPVLITIEGRGRPQRPQIVSGRPRTVRVWGEESLKWSKAVFGRYFVGARGVP